ncbi:MAG TPA: linear amide C-N hydrolase [Verrucomicrobiae bacterium]|nr:linear amide C-N hydrolase [Verrucomicrobiae bacterium]
MKRVSLLLLFCGCFSLPVFPCTTFVMQGGERIYFGRNLDWDWESGMVFVNQRNVQKHAFVAAENAVKWKSKYGSVTFNQFGREMPFGGMNEVGLVVENMWLDETKYPATDSRPEISMLQWIQYQLDNCKTVEEVIATDKQIRLENTPVRARIHYLVCDANGDTATIEFLDGKMEVHRGKDLGHRALANDPYKPSTEYLKANPQPDDLSKPLARTDSLNRFCRAAARATAFKPAKDSSQDVAYAFATLDQVRQGKYTVWQMVYDVPARQIHFRTLTNPQTRRVDLKGLNFDCNQPVQCADIQENSATTGTLPFKDFDEAAHRSYLTELVSQDSFKQQVGNVSGMIEPLLFTLRTYKCADQ